MIFFLNNQLLIIPSDWLSTFTYVRVIKFQKLEERGLELLVEKVFSGLYLCSGLILCKGS